jgi:hypothetical protein
MGVTIQVMMKVVNANPGMANPMTEEERKDFLANDKNKLLACIEGKEEGEPNIISAGCYFDVQPAETLNGKTQRHVCE